MSVLDRIQRVFIGLEVIAPWPCFLLHDKLIPEHSRHITLLFLGEQSSQRIEVIKKCLSKEKMTKIGFVGHFQETLFLPKVSPRVVAWKPYFEERQNLIQEYIDKLHQQLQSLDVSFSCSFPLLLHVSISRNCQDQEEWTKSFSPIPFMIHRLHLYESFRDSQYLPIWTNEFYPPFEEIDHTADLAFKIYGDSFSQLQRHAEIALSFRYPSLLPFRKAASAQNLNEVISSLNKLISNVDQEISCPFKAISWHSHLIKTEDLLIWEMIVDV